MGSRNRRGQLVDCSGFLSGHYQRDREVRCIATVRHNNVNVVREILLNRFRALSAFIAAHSNRDQIAILSSLVARKATFLLALI
jgi:hypothetical protein